MYSLILVTTQTFLGQYQTLDSCNKAMRAIIERQFISMPDEAYDSLSKEVKIFIQQRIDQEVKIQSKYVCVKQ